MNPGRAVKPELIYMDTGTLIAFFDKGDKNHEIAVSYFESSVLKGAKFVVGRPVLVEFLNGASKVNGKRVAIQLKNLICSSKYILIEDETEEDWEKAWRLFEKFKDQDGMDLVDCLSFAIMERLEITKAFTFDSDFATYGFTVVPRPPKPKKKQKRE
ncbi:type II toxin-antitoxin system VapC family toxin [Thermococcus barophilus]|nr:type II toxin-antitoxin system VapC family toxin [Thermococcus barophilus]